MFDLDWQSWSAAGRFVPLLVCVIAPVLCFLTTLVDTGIPGSPMGILHLSSREQTRSMLLVLAPRSSRRLMTQSRTARQSALAALRHVLRCPLHEVAEGDEFSSRGAC